MVIAENQWRECYSISANTKHLYIFFKVLKSFCLLNKMYNKSYDMILEAKCLKCCRDFSTFATCIV
jgi:hypothetical protein